MAVAISVNPAMSKASTTPAGKAEPHALAKVEQLETAHGAGQHGQAFGWLAGHHEGNEPSCGQDKAGKASQDRDLVDLCTAQRSHSPKTTSIAPRMAVASGSMCPLDMKSIAWRCENAVGRILQR